MAHVVGGGDVPQAPLIKPERVSLVSIDVLRASAALAVLIHHMGTFFDPIVGPLARPSPGPVRIVLDHGWLGVSLFFVISGFCIHLPYAMRPRLEPIEYLVRRFARIWPPFAAAVLFGLIVRLVAGEGAPLTLLKHAISGLAFVFAGGNLIFFDNVVFWSIVVEVQLYVIYLLIRLLTPQGRAFRLLAWTIAFLVFGVAYHIGFEWAQAHSRVPSSGLLARLLNPRFFAPARMGEWLLGALAADWVVRHADARPIARYVGVCVATGGLLLVVATRAVTLFAHLDQYMFEPIDGIGFTLLVWAVTCLEHRRSTDRATRVNPILNTGPAVRRPGWWASVPGQIVAAIGQRSYSIYLFHFLLLQLVARVGIRLRFPPGTTRESLMHSLGGLTLITAAVVIVFVVAELNYRFVELPTHRLARRFGKALARARA